jgi:hypothetical protein
MQICNLAMPDANKAAAVLKESLPSPAAWALLCCMVHLLKQVVNAQCVPKRSISEIEHVQGEKGRHSMRGQPEDTQHRRHKLRLKLAECFAGVWFPAIRAQEDTADVVEDYVQLLQKAAGTAANHARFLEMFLV